MYHAIFYSIIRWKDWYTVKKSKIGIVSTLFLDNKISKISVSSDYVNAIEKAAGLPMIIPITSNLENIDSYIDLCDGFLFTGGIDINPQATLRIWIPRQIAKKGFLELIIFCISESWNKSSLLLNSPSSLWGFFL